MERPVTVVSDVKDLSDLLNGASLEHVRAVPQGGSLDIMLELVRAMVERQHVVRQGWFRRLKTPWTKCQLTLKGIGGMTVKHLTDLAPGESALFSCDAVAGGYRLTVQAPDGLQLVLDLAQLNGTFTDLGSPLEAP